MSLRHTTHFVTGALKKYARILSAREPNKYLMKECISECTSIGVDLENIDCSTVLKPGNMTNGYLYTKCIKSGHRLFIIMDPSKSTTEYVSAPSVTESDIEFYKSKDIIDILKYVPLDSHICEIRLPPHAKIIIPFSSDKEHCRGDNR